MYIKKLLVYILIPILLLIFVFFTEPNTGIKDMYINIPKGYLLNDLSHSLKENKMIRSEIIFKYYYRLIYGGDIQAGNYYFENSSSIFNLANRFSNGIFKIKQIKITIPEGLDSKDISYLLLKNIPNFDVAFFLGLANKYEGYLFPDTYYLDQNSNPSSVLDTLRATYARRKIEIMKELNETEKKYFEKEENKIIIIASILEKEAATSYDRKMISDIIIRRMNSNYPLQIDATLGYIMHKGSLELTSDDLKIKSPYNTYLNKGLPPTAISNPGKETIIDVIRPIKNNFWFYLSDKDGKIYYSTTYDEHLVKRAKYLNK